MSKSIKVVSYEVPYGFAKLLEQFMAFMALTKKAG